MFWAIKFYAYHCVNLDDLIMSVGFNGNINLLMGGSYGGFLDWNKAANDIDKCFKIYFIREGKADVDGLHCTFNLEGPGLYFINGFSIRSQRCLEKMEVDWIHFLPESVYFNHVLKVGPCVKKLDESAFQSFFPLFKSYNSFFLNQMEEREDRVAKLEIQAFIQFAIAKVFQDMDKMHIDEHNALVRLLPALEYITTNYTNQINLKTVAEVCFLSPNYFHRLFTQTFGISPLLYIRQMRLQEALRQLVYTGRAVKEIAYSLGYEDEAYFSRTFSKVYGMSPGRYRKQYEKKLP